MNAPLLPGGLQISAGSVTLQIIAHPGSSRRGIVGLGPRGLTVAVHAPAAEGRANAELIEVLADALSIPRSSITLERGARGRAKLLRIGSPNPAALAAQIQGLAHGPPIKENRRP